MKKILFVCVENSCRSQMAEGFARHFGAGKIEAFSAGSKPSGRVDPEAVKAMSEAGIDISSQRSKGFFDLPEEKFDIAVTMGCKDVCPIVPAEKGLEGDIEDPKGKGPEFFRKIRDEIGRKVRELIEEKEIRDATPLR
jgi:protein-tyrosine-phosphatase